MAPRSSVMSKFVSKAKYPAASRLLDAQNLHHLRAGRRWYLRRLPRTLAEQRGADRSRVPFDSALLYAEERPAELIALDEALQRLSELDPRQCRIVELRFFGGLSVEEAAEVLGVSERTIKREWSVARAWLYAELSKHA